MNAWYKFLQEIEIAKSQLGFEENEECFYRGQSSSEYQLTPGLFRNLKIGKEKILDNEAIMFYEFKSRAKEIHNSNLTDWDILFYMQHHGCKTRLLDWTENFGVALHFALISKSNNAIPAIWLLNPYALNEKYHKSRDLYAPEALDEWDEEEKEYYSYIDALYEYEEFWWDKPIALYPIRRVDRLTTQGGYFTIHGNDMEPLNQQIKPNANIWKKIEIPNAAIKDAKKYLELFGINHFSLFPDLDGLAKYLNEKF